VANEKELTAAEKRFLGVNSIKDVEVLEGQTADATRQAQAFEQQLIAEAIEYGDSLMRYVIGHHRLSPAQRAWAIVLSILNVRREYPSPEEFDELADRGGADLQLQTRNVITDPDRITEIARDLPPFDNGELRDAAKFAEQFAGYIGMKLRQMGVDARQSVYGIGRVMHNVRFTFPMDQGGTAAFDELGRRAGAYYDRYKDS
jgi:hypothetical protein